MKESPKVIASGLAGLKLSVQLLRQRMNRWRYLLEDRGVYYVAKRTKDSRMIEVLYQDYLDHCSPAYSGGEDASASALTQSS